MNQDEFIQKAKVLQRELLELKTARLLPSNMSTYSANLTVRDSDVARQRWTIHFTPNGSGDAPIIRLAYAQSTWQETFGFLLALRPYDFATNTQKIELTYNSALWESDSMVLTVLSTREITSITKD